MLFNTNKEWSRNVFCLNVKLFKDERSNLFPLSENGRAGTFAEETQMNINAQKTKSVDECFYQSLKTVNCEEKYMSDMQFLGDNCGQFCEPLISML